MAQILIRGCRALLGETVTLSEPVDVLIVDGAIADIRPAGVRPFCDGGGPEAVGDFDSIDGSDGLLTAGLINGHFHSHEHFQKGQFEGLPLELWMNYVRPPHPVALTPRQIYLRTMVGAIEALRSGTTTVVDDVNIGAELSREQLAAVHQAYEDIGLRALVGVSMMDRPFFEALPFVEEEFPDGLLAALRAIPIAGGDALLEIGRELGRLRHPRAHRVGFILAPSAPQRCTPAFLAAVRRLADELALPIMIHVQETRLQVVTAQLAHGESFIAYLDEIGFLKPNTTLIHGVWLRPDDIHRLAASGASVQINSWSNLRLGSGVAPLRALLDGGVNVSLGTDGCSSTDTCNMLNSVGLAAATQTLRGDHSHWVSAREVWQAATIGGARAIGLGDMLGAIAPGRRADLVLYRMDRIPFTPLNDPLRQLVYAERGSSIDSVIIDGRVVMRQGKLISVDEAALLAEIGAEYAALKPKFAEAEQMVSRMRPALERIHARCCALPIASDHFPTRLA